MLLIRSCISKFGLTDTGKEAKSLCHALVKMCQENPCWFSSSCVSRCTEITIGTLPRSLVFSTRCT